jgi:hypothetical protein
MKINIIKSLFCLFAIAAVSPDYAALAQGKGISRSVIITNGDTVVNGRKFDELDKNERAKLRKEFKEMEESFRKKGAEDRQVLVRRNDDRDIVVKGGTKEPQVLVWQDNVSDKLNQEGNTIEKFKFNRDSLKNFWPDFRVFRFDGDSLPGISFNVDSLMQRFNFNVGRLDSNLRKRIITMNREHVPGFPGAFDRIELPGMRFEGRTAFPGFPDRNNSSSSTYTHTDKEGISSRISVRISEASPEQLKKISGAESIARPLDVRDLTLFPNFSSGKMSLSFNLAERGPTKVTILDSELETVFSEEQSNFSGNYVKQFSLPRNGVYYITVNQNGKSFIKRLVKE